MIPSSSHVRGSRVSHTLRNGRWIEKNMDDHYTTRVDIQFVTELQYWFVDEILPISQQSTWGRIRGMNDTMLIYGPVYS
jgi:hypothetical protein